MDTIITTTLLCLTIIFCVGAVFGFKAKLLGFEISINEERIGKSIFPETKSSDSGVFYKKIEELEEKVDDLVLDKRMRDENSKERNRGKNKHD